MPVGWIQMLDQGATLTDVEHLKAPADRKDREIPRERFFQHGRFQGVALFVRRFRFSLPCLAIKPGIHIRSAGQDRPLESPRDSGRFASQRTGSSPPASNASR